MPQPDAYSDILHEHSVTPPIPVEESLAIVRGKVSDTVAHLSTDKRAVYSEFSVDVEEVFKGSEISKRAKIKCDRLGGFVLCPGGKKVLYEVAGKGMPRSGKSYFLFLAKPDNSTNYKILTGYEISSENIIPLDVTGQEY